jgi:hypothetical protein
MRFTGITARNLLVFFGPSELVVPSARPAHEA